jgi:N-acetylglucosaminyl-diphospho-decaprenol L-rhamnosyltransferase
MTLPLLATTAVVTVSYNSSVALSGFLPSVSMEPQGAVAVVVVDNLSLDIDATRELCRRAGATLIEAQENLGYGGGANLGISTLAPSIDRVLISNPDVVVEPGVLGALAAILEHNPRVGAVGPRVRNADGSTYPSARSLPSLRSGVGHALFAGVWPGNPWSARYHADRGDESEDREAGWLSGACVMVRRTAFESLGGFDESFFMYFEDVDLGYRLGKEGWLNVYHPAVAVTHTGAHSTRSQPEQMVRAHHASAARYLDRRYRGPVLAPLRWVLRGSLRLREALEVARLRRSG